MSTPGSGKGKIHRHAGSRRLWKLDPVRELIRRPLVELHPLAHDDVEPTLAIVHDPEHLLVLCAFDEWLVDHHGQLGPLALTADPIETASALLDRARIPVQVVMNDMPAREVEVH